MKFELVKSMDSHSFVIEPASASAVSVEFPINGDGLSNVLQMRAAGTYFEELPLE